MTTHPPHVQGFSPIDVPASHYFWLQTSGYIDIRSEAHEKALLENIHSLWIAEEIESRISQKEISVADFRVQQALILTPRNDVSRVFFNDEISLKGEVKLKWKEDISVGDPITLGHIKDLVNVIPTDIEEDAGFVWLYHDGSRYQVWFDFTANSPDEPIDKGQTSKIIGESIARHFMDKYFHDVFEVDEEVKKRLLDDGWWPALCLIPFPYNSMVKSYSGDKPELANETAVAYFDQQRLDKIVSQWWQSPVFQSRKNILHTGVTHYIAGDWISCISVLVPQIEGLIMDERLQVQLPPVRHNQMVPTLPAISHPHSVNNYFPRKVLDSFTEYLEQVFLRNFNRTESTIKVGRHSVAHGATVEFDQVAALQSIIALDSLYHTLVY